MRRHADRELLAKLKELQEQIDRRSEGGREANRKRRRAIRHNCKVVIELPIGHSAGGGDWSVDSVKIDGRVLDLSAGGASLFTKQNFEPGQKLRLRIKLQQGADIMAHATVRWVKAVPEKHAYASGVQFEKVADDDERRIEAFLAELDRTAGL